MEVMVRGCLASTPPATQGVPSRSVCPNPLQDVWDSVDVERIRVACDAAASADLAVLLITVRTALAAHLTSCTALHLLGASYTS